MDEDKDIVAEIYEYYKDRPAPSEEAVPERDEKKNVFSSASELFSDITDKLAANPQDKNGMYITLAAAAAAVIIMIGAITGFLLPKNEEKVTQKAQTLMESDKKYLDAQKENKRLTKRLDTLYDTRTEVASELEKINGFETERDSSKKDMDDVSSQLNDLKSQIDKKQAQINELDSKIRSIGSKLTLTPGMYTVGKQISAGEYQVKGDGSLLVSDSQNKLKINTKLTETAAYKCRLSEGDIIKLETEAEFDAAG